MRSERPERLFVRRCAVLTAFLAVLSASAGAQQVSSVCDAPEELADVRVGGVNRGTFLVRRPAGQVWVQIDALKPGEERYGEERAVCDSLAFTRLSAALGATFDPEQLSVTFEPQLKLLPDYVVNVGTPPEVAAPDTVTDIPLYSVEYGLDLYRSGAGVLEQRARLEGAFTQGPVSARVGVTESGSSVRAVQVTPSASARYQLDRDSHVQVGWNVPPRLTGGQELLSGVQATGEIRAARLTEFTVNLPLPGTVTLTSGGKRLGRWTLGAGRVLFQQVPLAGSSGSIVATVEDAAGRREVSADYRFPAALLPPGTTRATVEAGALGAAPYAAAQAAYGLSSAVMVSGQASVKGGETSGALVVTTAGENHELNVGLSRNVGVPGTSLSAAFSTRLNDQVGLGIRAQIPLQNARAGTGEVNVASTLSGIATSAGVGFSGAQDGWFGRVQASGDLTEQIRVSAAARVGERSRQFSLTLGYRPDSQWSSVVSAAGGTGAPSVRATTTFTPTPGQRATLTYGAGLLYGEYERQGVTDVKIGAGSDGQVALNVAGAAAFTQGRAYARSVRGGTVSVLLETGVPNLPIFVSGVLQGRTDANGSLVLAVSPGEEAEIQVDTATLPIEITVREAKLQLGTLEAGAVRVNWRGNFQRSQVLQFLTFAGAEATYGTVRLPDGQEFTLDGFGTALIPDQPAATTAELILENGEQCRVTLGQPGTQGTVRCNP
ncbi:hypothetical protein [Deinococcus aquaticus]|uniref:Fimbrial biogenesis outer membrane usher protein n=1 Tax=Deinococcus aquaticus TaxID=328692 RepID=A0ABY7V582_9DEIO|nr:hypothetical protein [Deinococcus aquaticus]WDA60295.1 hypothetical protein M8445_16520 [Deinococcus aquaticus]